MKLKFLSLVGGFVWVLNIYAQTTGEGFYMLQMGQNINAKSIFEKLIIQSPNPKALFGLGEYYLSIGKADSAKIFFQKGIEIDKNDAYSNIGLAKVATINAAADVQEKLVIAEKLSKKNADALTELAKVYLAGATKNYKEASRILDKAKEVNLKFSGIYLLRAKICLEQKNLNDAANFFESAIYFDSTQFEAYIQLSRIYAAVQNILLAYEFLNNCIKKMPDCIVAYRELGEFYFNQGKYSEAALNYGKYIAKAEFTSEEKERYAYALFFSKEYDKAKGIIVQLSNNNPDNYIMLRLLSYTHFEKGEFDKGAEMFKKFFATIPTEKTLPLDYEYYARTLEKINSDSMAVIQYKNALLKDSSKLYLYDEMGRVYSKLKMYDKAAEMYNVSFSNKKNPLPSDYLQLGRSYYFAGNMQTDTTARIKYLNLTDSLFAKVTSLSPNSHQGYFWRARTNSLLDPETTVGLAKPYYEKALEFFIANPTKFQKEIIEVYSYLGFYYFIKEDYQTSKLYWKKIFEIDPSNSKALEALKGMDKF
jgi:tetratricopeptide (TPR) repeat protein